MRNKEIRNLHSNQGRDVTVSISAREADCAGANPVALTISNLRGETDLATQPGTRLGPL
jgi:hypothetical protein